MLNLGLKLLTDGNFLLLLSPNLVVYLLRDMLWSNVPVGLDAVNSFILSRGAHDNSICRSRRLVQEERALNLILTLLVSGWSRIYRDVPAMVMHITSIGTAVSHLRNGLSEILVGETLLN